MYSFLSQYPVILKCPYSHEDEFCIHNVNGSQLLHKAYLILLILYWLFPIFFVSVSSRSFSLFSASPDNIHMASALWWLLLACRFKWTIYSMLSNCNKPYLSFIVKARNKWMLFFSQGNEKKHVTSNIFPRTIKRT